MVSITNIDLFPKIVYDEVALFVSAIIPHHPTPQHTSG